MNPEHTRELYTRASDLLERGTLVYDLNNPVVAYAFVVPIELRDNLADILADIDIAEEEN